MYYSLNQLEDQKLNWLTPTEVAIGVTPDINELMCFHWYEGVLYYEKDQPFPNSCELTGRFVGITKSVGDTLTFWIHTDNT